MASSPSRLALNLILRVRYPLKHRIDDGPAAALLAFEHHQLAALLFLTVVSNPFAILFLAPVMISATVLPPIRTLSLGALAVIGTTLLAFSHLPLPWAREQAIGFSAALSARHLVRDLAGAVLHRGLRLACLG